jgi:hypothetical protein
MRDPAAIVARHPRLHGHSSERWAFEVIVLLHRAERRIGSSWARSFGVTAFSEESLLELRRRNIEGRLHEYGADLKRFESDLGGTFIQERARYPLVRVPSIAEVGWGDGSIRIRSQTFLVSYEAGLPVFLTREVRSRAVVKVTMKQMRMLHRTWTRWPAVLPSMLFSVLWHWAGSVPTQDAQRFEFTSRAS